MSTIQVPSQTPEPSTVKEKADQENMSTTSIKDLGDLEKQPRVSTEEQEVGEIVNIDLFDPLPPNPDSPDEPNPLTIRVVLIGWALGCLVNASNIYLGLKVGMANDATLFGTFFGYGIVRLMQQFMIPFLCGSFGPKEHSLIQTVATGTGGLSTLFIGAVPAMYQLGLMSAEPKDDYWKLVSMTTASALFGTALSVPFRKLFVVEAGRELQMVFPSAVAVSTAIRSFHLKGNNTTIRNSQRVLLITFVVCCCWVVLASYAKGILYDWYVTWWFYVWGNKHNLAIFAVNWGWFTIEWTPAFLGYGMLMGMNVCCSWLFGYFAAYGVIGPILVAKGIASGIAYDPEIPDLVTFLSLETADPLNDPSPRYWMMWPAIVIMFVAATTDMLLQWNVFARLIRHRWSAIAEKVNQLLVQSGRSEKGFLTRQSKYVSTMPKTVDPAQPKDRLKLWESWTYLLVSAIVSCLILGLHYHINLGISILTLVLGILFAVMAVQCTGQSGTSPISMVSNLAQLVIGAISRNSSSPISHLLLVNVVTGAVSSTAAQQACELTTDYKIGHFLGTPPRLQWYGQFIGTIPAIFISPVMFIVFMKAYGCVLDLSQAATCTFTAPGVQPYRVVADAVLQPTFPIPRSSWIFAICAAIFTVGVQCLKAWARKNEKKTLELCIPNMLVAALSVLVPASQYGIALVMGAGFALIWHKKFPNSYNAYYIMLAAGMIAGESIAGFVQAILTIAKVSGPTYYGTNLGCPAGSC